MILFKCFGVFPKESPPDSTPEAPAPAIVSREQYPAPSPLTKIMPHAQASHRANCSLYLFATSRTVPSVALRSTAISR